MGAGDGSRRSLGVLGVTLAALAIIAVLAWVWRAKERRETREAEERARVVERGPRIEVAKAVPGSPYTSLTLTGESRAYAEVTLNARAAGYLSDIGIDNGDRVRRGQVLAVIRAPETTEQYRGALADARNKAEIARRMRALLDRKLVAPQDYQQADADAKVAAARAGELAVTRGYQVVRAPFDGTVTARYVDPGALVQSAATPLFKVAQLDELRIYLFVDQRYAYYVRPGDEAHLRVPERPGTQFSAKVARLAGELDPNTRMMLVEVDYDNRRRDLVAGSYLTVELKVPTPAYPEVPLDAVVQQGQTYVVPEVEAGVVHYRVVQLGENDGVHVQITAGLAAGATVARHLGLGVADGASVQVVPPRAEPTPAAAPTAH